MRLLTFFLLLAALAVHATPSVEQIFAAGILPNCQQLVCCDNSSLAANPLFASLLEKKEDEGAEASSKTEQLPSFLKMLGTMKEKLPFGDFSSVKRTQFCADWSSAVSDPKNAVKNFRYLSVCELKDSFTPEQAMSLLAEESKKHDVKVDFTFDSEQEILNVSSSSEAGNSSCSAAFFHGNKVLMIGEPGVLQVAVNKLRHQLPPAQLSATMQTARAKIPSARQFYLLFAPDDNIHAAMQTYAPNSPIAPTLEEVACLTFTLQAGEKLALHLGLEFSSAQNASMGKSILLDGFFMGMGKMYLTQNLGAGLPMLQTMGTSLEGNYTALNCELDKQDIEAIKPLAKETFKSFVERTAR